MPLAEPPAPIEPAPDRFEPVVWVRRLVVTIGPDPDPATVIREIEFRRGLNIIRTTPRPPGEDRVIGHSVGKTLLARLLRYCLGEAHFARPDVAADLARQFPTGQVFAEVCVAGAGWVVARPLRDGRPSESWVVPTDQWTAGPADAPGVRRFADFVDHLSHATLTDLPEFRLPVANRPPRWLDLLGWLARDTDCKYQQPNEWRHPIARSGTAPLDRRDASLLTSWVMGLLDPGQIAEITDRHELQSRQSTAQEDASRLGQQMDALASVLTDRLGLATDGIPGGLFGDAATNRIADQRASLERLLAEISDADGVGRLQAAATAAAVRLTEVATERREHQNQLDAAELELRGLEEPPDPDAGFDPRGCPLRHASCSRHTLGKTVPPMPNASRDRVRQRIAYHRQRMGELDRQLPDLRAAEAAARAALAAGRRDEAERTSGVREALGRWTLLGEQLKSYEQLRDARAARVDDAEALKRTIADTLQRQNDAKRQQDRRLAHLGTLYEDTLRRVLGPGVSGRVELHARGLRPNPGPTIAANGDAMGSLGRVIAFDLACLTVAVCGVGRLPGLWVHDSPNAVELEPVLYGRIFQTVLDLERAYGDRPVGFQYVITTTTDLPSEVDGGPFVRLVLDRRDPDGLLLRRAF